MENEVTMERTAEAAIPNEVDKIHSKIAALEDGLKKLEEKMKAVLKPVNPVPEDEEGKSCTQTECSILRDQLRSFNDMLNKLINHLEELTARIEL